MYQFDGGSVSKVQFQADAKGTFFGSLAQNYAQPRAIATAYYDVVTKFMHGGIKTSDIAVTELVKAINAAK